MTTSSIVRLILAVTLAAIAAGCGPEPSASLQRVSHPVALAGTSWRLVAVRGVAPPAGADVTLSFGPDGRVSGDGPCNGFGGTFTYEAASGRLALGDLVSTKRACVDPARGQLETAYFEALRTATEASGDPEGRLVLTGSGAELVLEVAGRPVGPPVEASPPPSG
jgi:heat shock protein HslJ